LEHDGGWGVPRPDQLGKDAGAGAGAAPGWHDGHAAGNLLSLLRVLSVDDDAVPVNPPQKDTGMFKRRVRPLAGPG
jgi:hypothetical protein